MLLQPTTAVTSAQQRPSTREDLASTVLQHVARASPVSALSRHCIPAQARCTAAARNCWCAQPLRACRVAQVTTSKRTTGSTTSRWLEPFITVLPCPAPPAVWGDVCADLVSGGGGAFERWVTSACEELPDVHGSAAAHCQVARQPWAHRFNDPQLSAFVAALFLSVVAPPGRATAAWKRLGAPAPLLNRFDLWHGHLFLAHSSSGDTSSSSSPPPCRRSRTRGCGRRQRLSSCSRGGDKEQCTWQASSVGILVSLGCAARALLATLQAMTARTRSE
jgi:hypothetical protein